MSRDLHKHLDAMFAHDPFHRPSATCSACEGTGRIWAWTFRGTSKTACWDCNGTGKGDGTDKEIAHDD